MLKKISVIISALLILNGCAFLNAAKQKITGPEVKPVVIEESTNNNKHKPKKKKRQEQQASQPSQVKEDAVQSVDQGLVIAEETTSTDDTIQNSPTEEIADNSKIEANEEVFDENCSYHSSDVAEAVRQLAKQAVMSYQPRQPNLTMVYYMSANSGVCYSGTSLTTVLKREIEQSGRFNLINSSLENRIKGQLRQASNAYMIRITKSQNIDYVLSGNVSASGNSATVMLKVTDLRTGSVAWQRSIVVK
jgi:hypothetical protein